MGMAKYSIQAATDLLVIITDDHAAGCPTVTDSAKRVVLDVDTKVGGLRTRRLFYRDSVGRYDEICHDRGTFVGFAACSPSQQESFRELSIS